MNERKRTWNRWLLAALKLAIVGLVVWFIRRTLIDAWGQMGNYSSWTFHGNWIVLAVAFYLLGLFPPALFWYWCLRALGQHPSFGKTLRAYYLGHLGKYVPGKAMVVIIRAGMIGGEQVNRGVAAASVFLESLTWIAVASCMAAGYLVVGVAHSEAVFWGAIGLMIGTGIPTLPHVFPRLARLAGVGKNDPDVVEKLHRVDYRTTILGWLLMSVGWIFMGMAFWATCKAMGIPVDGMAELPRFTAAVALAVVAGFVFIFIPAGLGVREIALAQVMTPYLAHVLPKPETAPLAALAVSGLFRLVSVLSELGISGILYIAGTRKSNPPRETPPTTHDA